MKVLLIVIDGLGDLEKNGETPLSLAKKKKLNFLAKNGFCAISYPIGKGIVPGSDTGHLALFGYDPYKYYVGRGILEALGSNVRVYEGDVAFRANLATCSKFEITDRRAGRIDEESAKKLAKEIEHIEINGFDFYFYHTKGHRGVLIIRNASPLVTDTDPHSLGEIAWSKGITEEGNETAKAINKWTREINKILEKSEINKERKKKNLPPANVVLIRGGSSIVKGKYFEGATYFGPYVKEPVRVETFEERYGLKASCIAGGALYKGVGKYLGMDVVELKRATADQNTDLDEKFSKALSELERKDFVFLHIKGCDPLGHDGKFDEKRKFIEKIDKSIPDEIIKNKEILTIVTSDHSTPCSFKAHSAHPVPIVFYNCGRRNNVKSFDERSCSVIEMKHLDIMPMVMGMINKAEMYGS
jgi:2,3-bisphosphoglycerate-independent phosphoglycerate mutase